MIDHNSLAEAMAKSQYVFLPIGSFLVGHENARALAWLRNIERVATFAKKPPAWKDGARAGYALRLMQQLPETPVKAHLRELLSERIGRALFDGTRDQVTQFLDGMRCGFAFEAGKGVDTKDDYGPLIDRLIDEHFDELRGKTNAQGSAFIMAALYKERPLKRTNDQRKLLDDRIRKRLQRLGL